MVDESKRNLTKISLPIGIILQKQIIDFGCLIIFGDVVLH